MSPGQKVIQNERNKSGMKKSRENLCNEERLVRNEEDKSRMKRTRDNLSADVRLVRNKGDESRMTRTRENLSADLRLVQKDNDKSRMKIIRQRLQPTINTVHDENEIKMSIERSIKEAKHILHRTKHPDNPNRHRAIVCVICDCFVIGTEKICKLKPEQISSHGHRLSVKSYEEWYETKIKPELIKQYHINAEGLQDLLLSPRSMKKRDGYATCEKCFNGMRPHLTSTKAPPKFAIANGYVIGSFPRVIEFTNKEGKKVRREIKDDDLTDILKAMLAPIRMFGYVFAYSGGSQKSIKGNFQFFEMDQNKLGSVINHLNQADIGENIYCVICGRMTPEQKTIVRKRAVINTKDFLDILTWFVTESGHEGYKNITIPEECPQPVFVADQETNNNTDRSVDVNVETNFESGTYYFSSPQDPSPITATFNSMDEFAIAMFKHQSSPSLVVSGGTYVNLREMEVADVQPFAFPFGNGGPNMKRRVPVSPEVSIQHYLRLSLKQFMESPVIFVLNQMYNRINTYKTGVMLCRSNIGGETLGENLSTISMKDIEQIKNNKTDHLNTKTRDLLKTITTTCAAAGHTPEAAKYARRKCFAMLDYYGLNNIFLTITPDDECNIRVRLYCNSQQWVSEHVLRVFLVLKFTQISINFVFSFSYFSINIHLLRHFPILKFTPFSIIPFKKIFLLDSMNYLR